VYLKYKTRPTCPVIIIENVCIACNLIEVTLCMLCRVFKKLICSVKRVYLTGKFNELTILSKNK
jgi:hypothetical protein